MHLLYFTYEFGELTAKVIQFLKRAICAVSDCDFAMWYASGVNLEATYNRFRNVLVTLALILAFVLGASRVFVLGVAV